MQDLRLDWGAAPQGPRRATELCDAAAAATAARRGDAGEKGQALFCYGPRRSIHDCFNSIDPSQTDPSHTYVGFFHSIPRRAPESENRSEAENTGLMLVAVLDPILIIVCLTSR